MAQETNFYCFILRRFQPHNFQSLTNAEATFQHHGVTGSHHSGKYNEVAATAFAYTRR